MGDAEESRGRSSCAMCIEPDYKLATMYTPCIQQVKFIDVLVIVFAFFLSSFGSYVINSTDL